MNLDPSFYYVREGGEWVPKSQAAGDGGREGGAE